MILLSYAVWLFYLIPTSSSNNDTEIVIKAYYCGNQRIFVSSEFTRPILRKLMIALDMDTVDQINDVDCEELIPFVSYAMPQNVSHEKELYWTFIANLRKIGDKQIFAYLIFDPFTLYEVSNHNGTFQERGCLKTNKEKSYAYYVSDQQKLTYASLNNMDPYDENQMACNQFLKALQDDKETYSFDNGSPMVIVPGLITSTLFAQNSYEELEKAWFMNENVFKSVFSSGYAYRRWFSDLMRVDLKNYGEQANATINDNANEKNSPFVVHFGHPKSVDKFEGGDGFAELAGNMTLKYGYVPGYSLRAAPYDFRYAPNTANQYFKKLKGLIEETYYLNNERRVVILAHSMGNLYSLYFLNRLTQTWKDKYVASIICLAAPWGGSVSSIIALTYGYTPGLIHKWGIERLATRESIGAVLKTFPSVSFLLPNTLSFAVDELLYEETVWDKPKQFGIYNYEEMFADYSLHDQWKVYQIVHNLTTAMIPPNVKVYCAYSTGIPTDKFYKSSSVNMHADQEPEGDGIVSVRSANRCLRWKGQQNQEVANVQFEGLEHSKMLKNERLYLFLKSILFN